MLSRCGHWMAVRRTALLDEGGDHACMITQPVETHSAGQFRPLRVSDVSGLVPGHATADRPAPPTQRAE